MACGFAGGYLPVKDINELLGIAETAYADFCKIINLEASEEGRPIRALKLGKGSSATRRGVLFVGGIHARELINPDALIYFAFGLASAYKMNKDFIVAGQKYTAAFVRTIIESMDIFILPLANPDGREFVLAPNGNRLWRKNRATNPFSDHKGVDINRNFDFMWSSGLGTYHEPSSDTYKGHGPVSEPETRNVRHLLEAFPHIVGMIDLHSYSELITYPWPHDENQTTNSTVTFTNPVYKTKFGQKGDAYKEYIPPADLAWYKEVAQKMAQAIFAVRGRKYTIKQSIDIYAHALSATCDSYAYSRNFVNSKQRKVFSFVIETGPKVLTPGGFDDEIKSFQPSFPEAACIMEDVQPALMEFCLQILCAAQELIVGVKVAAQKAATFDSAGRSAQPSRTASKFAKLLEQSRKELIELARQDIRLWRQAAVVLERILPIIQGQQETQQQISVEDVRRVNALSSRLAQRGSPKLQRALRSIQQDLQFFVGKTTIEGFKAADAQRRHRK